MGYPILGPDRDDYTDSEFQASIQSSIDSASNQLCVDFQFNLSQPELKSLIERKEATYAFKLVSRNTMYCEVRPVQDSGSLAVSLKHLEGNVQITPLIVAQKPIHQFVASDLHEEFGDDKFEFNRGDNLAFGEATTYNIEYEKLTFDSLIKMNVSSNLDDYEYSIVVSPNQDEIVIYVGKRYQRIFEIVKKGGDRKDLCAFAMSLYKDCLIAAYYESAECDADSLTRWVKPFREKLRQSGEAIPESGAIEFDEANRIAQKLITDKGIKHLEGLLQ